MTTSRLLLRQWRKRPGRALATAASVAVAVAALVATWVAADASRAGYRRLAETVEGVPSIDISSRGGGRFEAASLPRLGDIPGVRAVVPLFFRPTLLRIGEKRVREVAVGVDVAALVDAGLLTLSAGRPCDAADEIVLDASLAEGLEKHLGDEVIMFARRSIRRMQVVGIADSQSLKWFAEGAGVVVGIQPLEEMSNAFGLVDRVRVVITPEGSRPAVLASMTERLPATLVAEVPAGRAGMAEDILHSANLGLDFVTGLTVAMAFFLVGNAMLMNVTERRRSYALLRVLGATGRQVKQFVMTEAALLGLAGSVVGATLGLAAAGPISVGISHTLQAPAAAFSVHPLVIPVAIALGTLVAMAAAWWPAREAVLVEPLAGLADAPPPPRGVSGRFLLLALLMWAVSAVIMVLVVWERLPPRAAVPSGILMMLAFVATTPMVLPTLCAACARLIPERWRIERTLAVEQVIRQPIRTALTTGVLVVAVSNAVGLGHAIRDNVDDVRGWYTRLMKADWMLTHAGMVTGGLSPSGPQARLAEAEVRALPGVKRVDGIGVATGRVAGGACIVVARDMPADAPLPIDPVGTSEAELRQALDRGEVAAGTLLARRAGIKPGDEVDVEVFGRTTRVKIAALVVDYTSGGASLLLRRDAASRLFGLESADIVLVTAEPGKSAALHAPLLRIAEDRGMLLRSFENVQAFINGIVGGVVDSLWAILGLGFVVGSLGVANTVTMNVLEKTRTLGLLRAIGMTSGQVTRLVVLESVLLGVAGGLIGTVGGMFTALLIQFASQPLLGHPIRASLRPTVVIVNLVAAVAVTALAAWIPARRAVRLDLLESIASE
jgi:putative ABC transport system permease protein